MIEDSSTLPVPVASDRVSRIAQLADIPEEGILAVKAEECAHAARLSARRPTLYVHLVDQLARGVAPGRPPCGDQLGALYARGRGRRIIDDPPAARRAHIALQAFGAARPRGAQSGRRGRAAGDQPRQRGDRRLFENPGAQTARPARRSVCAAPRLPPSRLAICTRTVIHCA